MSADIRRLSVEGMRRLSVEANRSWSPWFRVVVERRRAVQAQREHEEAMAELLRAIREDHASRRVPPR